MFSRFRTSKDQSSGDLPALQFRHVDRIRYLLKLSRSLQALKCHLDLDLPKIAVLGGPLVKQVPLLECLTGIKLPSELEYDQRTPIEFHLINITDGDWTCRIKIRREYKTQNNKKKIENVEETTYGEIIDDPAKVEGLLREAQAYLLGHEQTSNSGEQIPQRNQRFSENVICVEIQGNSIVDLTLITLPNFTPIQSSRALQEFTLSYLAKNCWILLLTTGIGRLQAHPAFHLVQTVDPLGDRTLGLFCCANAGDSGTPSLRINRSGSNIWPRLEVFHNRPAVDNSPSPTLRTSRSLLRCRSINLGQPQPSRWKIGKLEGQFLSETRFDLTFNDLELKMFLENISCELFEKSMSRNLQLISQINSADKPVPIPRSTDDTSVNDVSRYIHAACVSEIKYLMTSMIAGERFSREIESIYKLLGRRALAVLPLFIPLASKDDDIAAFRQITEFSDMNLYVDAYRFKDFEKAAIFSRRPRVYLREVRYHLRRMNPDAPENHISSGQKTPLMDLPIMKWKSYAFDAISSVVCLLQDAIEDIISKRCEDALPFRPCIMKIIFLQINQIFDNAMKSLSDALEFELVPYTEFFPQFSKIRDCLLDDYHLSRHLLNQETKTTAKRVGHPDSNQKNKHHLTENSGSGPKVKKNDWDVEINACAEAGAYLNLALANFLDKTSMIIEKDLLEQIEMCDLVQLPALLPPEIKKLLVDDVNKKLQTNENSRSKAAPPLDIAAQLAKIIESTMKEAEDELQLLDPFM